jgi:outer membrane protein OmpA-like peptidoglycan-associated protein
MTFLSVRCAVSPRRWLALCCASLLLVAGCQTVPPVEGLSEAQVAALRDIGFHEEGEGWGFDLDGRLLFDSDTANLSSQNRETIARVVTVLKEVGINRVHVNGYADSSGKKHHNEVLSRHRAEAVAREIERQGLPYKNITVRGYGTAHPVADNATKDGRAQNRRVVIIVPTEIEVE